MKQVQVEVSCCPQNHACPAVRVCPVGALVQEGFQAPKVEETCVGCGQCVAVCPKGALHFEKE